MAYETTLLNLFNQTVKFMKTQPLNLGGYATYSGGGGGPPGGFIGYLPQTRVAFDETEAETYDIVESGVSLVDNLNRIRYRISNLELGGGLTIQQNDVVVDSGVFVLDFSNNFELTALGGQEVAITLAVSSGVVTSGIFNEDLSSQLPTTNFITNSEYLAGTLRLYYNGLRQEPTQYSETGANTFTTVFSPSISDVVTVDYEIVTSGNPGHTHAEYVTQTQLEENYTTTSGLEDYLSLKADEDHTHLLEDIEDWAGGTDYILDTLISGEWQDRYVLSYDVNTDVVYPRPITIHQQFIFTIEGAYLSNSYVGTKPLKIYSHDVEDGATITKIFCCLGTAPVGGPVVLDIYKNGVSITSSGITLADGVSSVSETGITSADFFEDDYFQLVLVSGNATASDLTTHIRFDWRA